MDIDEFYQYILDNFTLSGEAHRLVYGILRFVERRFIDKNERYNALIYLLDSIGLTGEEIQNYI